MTPASDTNSADHRLLLAHRTIDVAKMETAYASRSALQNPSRRPNANCPVRYGAALRAAPYQRVAHLRLLSCAARDRAGAHRNSVEASVTAAGRGGDPLRPDIKRPKHSPDSRPSYASASQWLAAYWLPLTTSNYVARTGYGVAYSEMINFCGSSSSAGTAAT